MISLRTTSIIVLCCATWLFGQTVKRDRNEGTFSIPASNTMGSTNLSAYIATGAMYGSDGYRIDPIVGARIGIADLMQFSAQTIIENFRKIGLTQAHLQMTLPGNDKLRFFGLAARADLYLSTAIDTISFTVDSSKPEYSPFLNASAIIDLDWLALNKQVPLKTYLYGGLADNAQELFRYDQIGISLGLEWKMYAHAIFLESGMGFYKEKRQKLCPAGDRGYEQNIWWVQGGGRYRFFNRFSLVGTIRLPLLQHLKDVHPLPFDLVGIALRLEIPMLFKETNTEAIRTLVFMENKKAQTSATPEDFSTKTSGEKLIGELNNSFNELDNENQSFDYNNDKEELTKKREEIQKKMDEIELLLKDVDQ